MKHIKFFIFFCIIFFSTFLFIEIIIRFYHVKTYSIPFTRSLMEYYDPLLGWEGKKIFGDPNTDRKKIFVVGDSYTDGAGADETKMYYRVIAKALNAELFIYGGPGYGTLQEYLIIDKYLDEINPDLIILQVCLNDFINNSHKLEKGSFSNNNLMVRPYLVNDKIEYYFPRFLGKYRIFLSQSRLIYMAFNSYDIIMANLAKKGKIESSESKIGEKGLSYKPFADSKKTTFKIVKMIKGKTKNTPIIAVAVSSDQPYSDQFADIFSELNIPYLLKPAQGIEKINSKENPLYSPVHGHLNEKGNQIFGKLILHELSQMLKK